MSRQLTLRRLQKWRKSSLAGDLAGPPGLRGWSTLNVGEADPWAAAEQAFVDAVARGGQPPFTGEDGLRALEACLAGYESARTGQPVRLSAAESASPVLAV